MFKKNIDNEVLTVGSVLLPILEKLGIDTIFGIPGVHTVEIYRGLEKTKIKHIRHGMNKVQDLWLMDILEPVESLECAW